MTRLLTSSRVKSARDLPLAIGDGALDVRAGDDLFVQHDGQVVEGLLVIVGVGRRKLAKILGALVGQLELDAKLAGVGVAVGRGRS